MGAIKFDYNQAGWGSLKTYRDGALIPFKLDKIVIHYGGYTDPGSSVGHEMEVLKGWQRWHMYGRGWFDIAYGFATGNSGTKYRLRGFNRQGATSGDFDGDGIKENSEALSLVWIGGTPYEPTEAAYKAMGEMILDVFSEYGEVPVTVHSDHKATGCPGDYWRAWRERKGWLDYAIVDPPQKPREEYEMLTIHKGDGYKSKGTSWLRPTVKAWQAILAHHKFADPNSTDGTCSIDGVFGSGTEGGTEGLQAFLGLEADGIVGPKTWAAATAGPN